VLAANCVADHVGVPGPVPKIPIVTSGRLSVAPVRKSAGECTAAPILAHAVVTVLDASKMNTQAGGDLTCGGNVLVPS
jgi:hypothetical protein